jgi:hypothetical protein
MTWAGRRARRSTPCGSWGAAGCGRPAPAQRRITIPLTRSHARTLNRPRDMQHLFASELIARIRSQLLTSTVPAAVVKLVYTRRSGRRALTGVEVRILSAALTPSCIPGQRQTPARGLAASGASATEVARELGLPRSTIRDWQAGQPPRSVEPPQQAAALTMSWTSSRPSMSISSVCIWGTGPSRHTRGRPQIAGLP